MRIWVVCLEEMYKGSVGWDDVKTPGLSDNNQINRSYDDGEELNCKVNSTKL